MKDKIKYIAFDADDTLWENELYFQEFEKKYCHLLRSFLPASEASQELFNTEMKNLPLYGYGLKAMMLSMIETVCRITDKEGQTCYIEEIIKQGQELLQRPVTLLNGVEEVLPQLQEKYKLILATKGDLFDQERKITKSELQKYFCHIEIMSDKKQIDYEKLIGKLNCSPQQFLMIGNSVKSDIMPVLNVGGYAIHIPHSVTWKYEQHDEKAINHPHLVRLTNMKEVLNYLI